VGKSRCVRQRCMWVGARETQLAVHGCHQPLLAYTTAGNINVLCNKSTTITAAGSCVAGGKQTDQRHLEGSPAHSHSTHRVVLLGLGCAQQIGQHMLHLRLLESPQK
jgi:hypothetical protein